LIPVFFCFDLIVTVIYEMANSVNLIFVDHGDAGDPDPSPKRASLALLRVSAATIGSMVVVVPWLIAAGVEEVARAVNGGNEYRSRGAGWSALCSVYNDVAYLSSGSTAYASMRWRFPKERAVDTSGTGLVALTIDDAPGDNPAAFSSLLDCLRELGIRATFFCTTDLISNAMESLSECHCRGSLKLAVVIAPASVNVICNIREVVTDCPLCFKYSTVWRVVGEGHEVANHCPADRPYAMDSAAAFEQVT
jgi:hypothetical protein